MNTRVQLTTELKKPWRRLRRLCRVLGGRDLWGRPEIRLRTERFGSEYGGWTVAPLLLRGDSVVYSFGVGQDISFDLALIERFGCRVHAFDPTPRSLEWVRRQTLPEEFQLHAYGLGNTDGAARFAPPADSTHASYSMIAGSTGSNDAESLPVRRLRTISEELGHDRIDLLKMDIEGAEYEALEDLLKAGPSIDQLLVEFHHRLQRGQVARTRQALTLLREAGYVIFDVAPSGEEYSFVHRGALTPTRNVSYEQHASP